MSARRGARPEGPPGEFELIARLAEVVGVDAADEDLMIGIGDDAAVVRRGGLADIYTTDTVVDGVHFKAGQIPWRDLGWKSLAVNLSDIAAMGGRPLYSLVTLGVTPETSPNNLLEAYRGMADAARDFGGRVVGGDIVRSPVLFITVAMIGTATMVDGEPVVLTRSSARAGDKIAVTGSLGASAGGLRSASSGLDGQATEKLLRSHYAPVPRIGEGQALVRAGVLAAMDVSDGLVADLGKLCGASGVCATIRAELVPVADELKSAFPADFLQLALGGGEDYELLFTAPPPVMRRALGSVGPTRATVIGEITAPGDGKRDTRRPGESWRAKRARPPVGVVRVVDAAGRPISVPHAGWDHLIG